MTPPAAATVTTPSLPATSRAGPSAVQPRTPARTVGAATATVTVAAPPPAGTRRSQPVVRTEVRIVESAQTVVLGQNLVANTIDSGYLAPGAADSRTLTPPADGVNGALASRRFRL
jgi:hypothetical protein